jgi:UDP-GlcNAc:undecaprenyl-phosphate GlcNAc-1-phosphate transferase
MPIGLLALAGLVLPLVLAYAATPLAIRAAGRWRFYDLPIGYKGHAAPTPYLGGAAVVGAFIVAALIVAGRPAHTLPVVAGMAILWAVGTVDDRIGLSPWLRLGVEFVLATALWALGLGWDLGLGGAVDLVMTVLWIAAVVNAFNLFDNMDGAASTMAAAAAAGTAVLGILIGDRWLTVSAAALCGACLGFLPYNLASPAKIFLGDGGSMPVGFGIASLVMIGSADAATEWQALATGLLFVGIPAVDTCLVTVSRRRRRVPLLTGGRDHLTHRTHGRLRTARAVAVALGGAQALLAALALLTLRGGSGALVGAVLVYLVVAAMVIVILDSDYGGDASDSDTDTGVGVGRAPRGIPPSAALLVPFGLAVGASSFVDGFYDSKVWAPVGLVMLALNVALALVRPPRLSRPAVATLIGLVGLAVLALVSSRWADSVDAAVVNGNRYFVLAALLASGVLLVRDSRDALWALGAVSMGAVAVGLYQLSEMLFTDGRSVISAGGRLEGPLGYINGQGSVFVLAAFPALALAERIERPRLAGVGAAVVTLCAGLVVLTQSRGALLAALAGGVLVVAVAPGRLRRAAALCVMGLGLAASSAWILDVYRSGGREPGPPIDVMQDAAVALLAASAAVGVVWWWAVGVFVPRLGRELAARLRRVWAGALCALGALLLVAGFATGALPDRFDDMRRDFTQPAIALETPSTSSRLGSGDSNRYEYWRIAWEVFREHPVGGVGGGNYAAPYFQRRTTVENVTQPHSVVFQTLAELGAGGALLLALFVAGLAWGGMRLARTARRSPDERTIFVAAAGLVTAWMVHATVDWIHLLPGVTGMALLGAAALLRGAPALAGEAHAPVTNGRRRRSAPALAVMISLGIVGGLAAITLSRQALAEYYMRDAQQALTTGNSVRALEQVNRSLRADRDAMPAYWAKAGALSRLGRESEAGAVLEDARRREPRNFVTYVLLGDHHVRAGDLAAARAAYTRAVRLNPRDQTLRRLARSAA